MAVKVEQAPTSQELAALEERYRATRRLIARKKAKDILLEFAKLMMPHPQDPEDADKTRYDTSPLHTILAEALEAVERGEYVRLIITVPPRHGKTQLVSKLFPAWYVGRDPYRNVILATYNETLAKDYGRAVRDFMKHPHYKDVFPHVELKKGSQSSDHLETVQGGALNFVGRGGTITGRGGDLVIIDDPLKSSEEASSVATREALWAWFNSDVMSRFMTDAGICFIITTRWHEDDLVGRLTDPTNPCFKEEEAAQWKIINIPALAEADDPDDDPLGRTKGEALWPTRFGVEYLLSQQRRDPVSFAALYQQHPAPMEGVFFKADMLRTYHSRNEIPTGMRIYAASDHAVAGKQNNDRTCLMIVGVDDQGRVWVLDVWWKRADTAQTVEAMITLMRKWKPLKWWAEQDHIAKSIGPFLRRRMFEEEVFCAIEEVPSHKDKVQKAQAIQGRMAMGLVLFPDFEFWWPDAKDEMLKFDRGRHDDFVDAISAVGRGLQKMVRGVAQDTGAPRGPRPGSWGWVKKQYAKADAPKKSVAEQFGF